jgi:hypothetical protein
MRKESNETVIVKSKAGAILCVTDTEGNDIPMEFPNVQKAMEYLKEAFDHPNLYDDYDYELRPSCKEAPLPKLRYYSSTHNKVKRVTPQFDYGTEPWRDRGYECYIEKRSSEKDSWVLRKRVSGYTSLTKYIPTKEESLFYGSLSECKAKLQKLVEESPIKK